METKDPSPSELEGWRVGDDVTVMNGHVVGFIKRIDPNHGLGRWPYLVVFPRGGGFCWSAAEWLTKLRPRRGTLDKPGRMSTSPPRPMLDLSRRYTFYLHQNLRRFCLRPWWATGTQGLAVYSELVWHARSRERLEAKLTRFARRDMLSRGLLGEPEIEFRDVREGW